MFSSKLIENIYYISMKIKYLYITKFIGKDILEQLLMSILYLIKILIMNIFI